VGVGVYGDIQLHRAGQVEAFDAIGSRYDEAFPDKEGQIAAAGWLAESLPIGARVLDIGCGTGLPTCRQLVDAGLEVTGIDVSAGMLALARESVPEATFHRADIIDVGRLDRSDRLRRFEGVSAFFSLLMLPRAEIPQALAIVRDLLVPGGWFTLGMVEADLDDFEMPFLGNTVRVSGYLRDDLRQVVEDAGFDVLKEDSFPYSPAALDAPPEEQLFLHCRRRA
jgi:predicted TPR repeat methyltransferase